jgi:hypothetical protein
MRGRRADDVVAVFGRSGGVRMMLWPYLDAVAACA